MGFGGVSENLDRFPELTKIGHVQNHGLCPGFLLRVLAQKRPNFDPCEFARNRHRQSRIELEIILEGLRRRFREFAAISRTCHNRSYSKPWTIAQVFAQKRPNVHACESTRNRHSQSLQTPWNAFLMFDDGFITRWSSILSITDA